jgi:GT2 family glycosyltransferase
MTETIAAVIVTYQRTDLLVRCLESLLAQTHPVNSIILVDNNPDEQLKKYLENQGYLNSNLYDYLKPDSNIGGAGGFQMGMQRAHEQGFNWIWLIDDDGFLAPDCLAQLLAVRQNYDVIGPVVCQPEQPEDLTWGYRRLTRTGFFKPRSHIETLQALKEFSIQDCYDGFTNFFNGVLFRRQVLEDLGYPIKELFCWGDEVEYFMRCKKANKKITTAIKAKCYHPKSTDISTPFKFYYRLRNTCYIHFKYHQVIYAPLIRYLYPIYILLKSLRDLPSYSPQYLFHLLWAISDAFQGRLRPFSS